MEENKLKLLMGKCKPGEYEDCFGIPLMGKYVENFPYGVATSTVHGNFPKGIIKIEIAISMRIFHIKSRIPIRH